MNGITYDQAADYLNVIRDMIKHENEVVNQRLSWLFTLQGLLFTAISFLWEKNLILVVVLCIVGIISCISIGYFLYLGQIAITDLMTDAKNYTAPLPPDWKFPPLIGITREKSRTRQIIEKCVLPSRLLPWVLLLAWVVIAIFRFTTLCP